MKKKDNRKSFSEFDKFDRKQKRYSGLREKSSKHKFSIYDEFDEDDSGSSYASSYKDEYDD